MKLNQKLATITFSNCIEKHHCRGLVYSMPPTEKLAYKIHKDYLTKEKPEQDRWYKKKEIKRR